MNGHDPQQSAAQQWAWLARIRHFQGRKGEVFADILTDFPEKFAERRQLWLIQDPDAARPKAGTPKVPQEVELTAHWLHKGGIVLHFAHSNSISTAEALTGLIVAIPQAARAALDNDEIYIADLIGCTLFDVAGPAPTAVGQIAEVDRTAGPVALLVVNRPGAIAGEFDEILIPFAKAFLRSVDIPARRIEMALPAGLVDLNR